MYFLLVLHTSHPPFYFFSDKFEDHRKHVAFSGNLQCGAVGVAWIYCAQASSFHTSPLSFALIYPAPNTDISYKKSTSGFSYLLRSFKQLQMRLARVPTPPRAEALSMGALGLPTHAAQGPLVLVRALVIHLPTFCRVTTISLAVGARLSHSPHLQAYLRCRVDQGACNRPHDITHEAAAFRLRMVRVR